MVEPVWVEDADPGTVADAIARRFDTAGPIRIAVPGGKTPIPVFEHLAGMKLPWARATIGLTDDRIVPPEHEASNFGLLTRALGGTGATLEPMRAGPVAPWQLVWLGMGDNGHIASIFPAPDFAVDLPAEVVRYTPDPLPPEAPFARLTQTYAALNATEALMLVVRGQPKRAVLEAAIAGTSDLPIARLLARATAPVTIYWSP